MYKFNRNKLDSNTIKYEFENSDKGKLTFNQFLTLLKSENQAFLQVFGQALNNATEELTSQKRAKSATIRRTSPNPRAK